MTAPNWTALAEQALAGELIARDDALAVLRAPDDQLLDQLAAAYRVRRHHWGNRVRLHFLLNAQSGLCPEDCGYCSQSKVSAAEIEKYPMLARERILDAADRAARLKAGTFCMVISGRSPGGRVFEKVLDAVREVRARHDLKICACLGLLSPEQAVALREAGVTQVNHNLNTSAAHTPNVVSTHTFEDRVATVEHVKAAGLKTCSGGIIGLGETDDDVVDLALSLRALDPRRCLRVLCLYRLLLPSQEVRIAGRREVHLRSMQVMGLYAANSIFIGDYLTTQGAAARADLEMIRDAGFVLETPDGAPFEGDPLAELPESYPRAPLPLVHV